MKSKPSKTSKRNQKSTIKSTTNPIQVNVLDLKTAKNVAVWGTRGKMGIDPLKFVRLRDCETAHLQAILATQFQIRNTHYETIIKSILDDRKAPYINPNPERITK